jgi:hypothetical protein
MQETAKRGVLGGPSFFFCAQHTDADVQQALKAIGETMVVMRKALDSGDPESFLECPVRQVGFRRLV